MTKSLVISVFALFITLFTFNNSFGQVNKNTIFDNNSTKETPDPFKPHPGEPEKMILVKGGSFMMGCQAFDMIDCDQDEVPIHKVILSDFNISAYPVTQKQWKAVMDSNPSTFQGDDNPVENVSWVDVNVFIKYLNEASNKNYRLPTEAEWEYAARGGRASKGYVYSGGNHLNSIAWYESNSNDRTQPVGKKQPNELGIYDMTGNVWEWCSDWYGAYSPGEYKNPEGPSTGELRILRGGSFDRWARDCRVSYRGNSSPNTKDEILGFRLVHPVKVDKPTN